LSAANIRGSDMDFGPYNLIDGDPATYWSTDDNVTSSEVTLDFLKPITLNALRVREFLPLGQRVECFALDVDVKGKWRECVRGTGIGNCRLLRFEPQKINRVRLRIEKSAACPAISEFSLFSPYKHYR
jgi:alpha-L-fucosidase